VIRFHGLGTPRKYSFVLCLSAAGVISSSACNSQSSAGIPTTRTGILLARDNSNEWALESGRELFFVRGKARELAKFERRRVAITGTVSVGRQLTAESIAPSELPNDEIRALVEQLRAIDGLLHTTSETQPIGSSISPSQCYSSCKLVQQHRKYC